MVLNLIDVFLLIWLGAITIILYTTVNHYRRLTKNSKGENLQNILEDVIRKLEYLTEQANDKANKLSTLEEESKHHFRKMAVIRFNPFKDTGGNQSFVLALLTQKGDGFVLSNLYARTGSRWYAKSIKRGKSQEMELSKEEEEAVKSALKV